MGSVVCTLSLRKEGVEIQSCYCLPRIVLKLKAKDAVTFVSWSAD